MTLGNNIRKIASNNKVSIYRVAKDSNLSLSYVWEIVNEKKKNPSLEVLKKLSKALDISIEDLIKEE